MAQRERERGGGYDFSEPNQSTSRAKPIKPRLSKAKAAHLDSLRRGPSLLLGELAFLTLQRRHLLSRQPRGVLRGGVLEDQDTRGVRHGLLRLDAFLLERRVARDAVPLSAVRGRAHLSACGGGRVIVCNPDVTE